MDKQLLRNVVLDQHSEPALATFVPRSLIDAITPLKQSNQALVLSGIRRCGKSTLMQHLRETAIEHDYWINFDDDRLVNFSLEDFQGLYELFIELYGEQTTFYPSRRKTPSFTWAI